MLREFDKYRKDGYIDLNQLDTETEKKNLPPNIHFSFMYQGEKYYVKKREGRKGAIREIVNQSNAVALSMDNAQYDIVKYGSHSVGAVTKSFIKEGSEFQTGKEFLLKNSIIESLSDEKNIYGYIIALLKSGCPIEEVKIKLRIMLERHIMDILSIQTDRHNENSGFLKTSQSIELAPRFDNAKSFLYDKYQFQKRMFVKSDYKKRRKFLLKKEYLGVPSLFYGLNTILPVVGGRQNFIDSGNIMEEYWRVRSGIDIPYAVKSRMAYYILSSDLATTPDEIYQMIQEEMAAIDPFIEKAYSVDTDEIIRELLDSNIPLTQLEQDLFKAVQDTTKEMFSEAKQLVYYRR